MKTWFVYILQCADGSLYTGISTDVGRRTREHNGAGRLGARYTRGRRPVQVVYQEATLGRADAVRRESQIKRLSRADKLALIVASHG